MLRVLVVALVLSLMGFDVHAEVRVEIFEKPPTEQPFQVTGDPTSEYALRTFAWTELPTKYMRGGLIQDRSNPFMMRATSEVNFAGGQCEILLRTKHLARVLLDGETIVEQTERLPKNKDSHEPTPELPVAIRPGHRPRPSIHHDVCSKLTIPRGSHTVTLEAVIGGSSMRAEIGELCLAIAEAKDEWFYVLASDPSDQFPLSDSAWNDWNAASLVEIHDLNTKNRRTAAAEDDDYWQTRHAIAKDHYEQEPSPKIPVIKSNQFVSNEVDQFVLARLEQASITPEEVCDDLSFLRRLSLDVVGRTPTLAEVYAFERDESPDRRNRWIDRFLQDPSWADHWVSYWQDVLAENPNILKASLNNTGPFRWWIYESFLDNKSMDRFATELILMRGSKYNGGPAGFAMATQNDVPLANKALVLSKAFLAANLNCARCHDSPVNDYTQKQLFSIAAMLDRRALELPASSTVALDAAARAPAVEVSLSPGDQILPRWTLEEIASDELPKGFLRDASDPREWLAAIITSPRNDRFAKVIVNRLWHRLLGRGIVDTIDDWHDASPSHPDLLSFLARELVLHHYDLKHVARLILRSQTYQRAIRPEADEGHRSLFASATRRRLTAEQIFDSLFSIAEKDVHAERLTMDPEGRRPISTFLNLGVPTRAWQFSSLSNERDRPALSLPVAQSVNDLLKAFGWRESRQDPRTTREETITPLQPLVLANGTIGRRLVGLSDDHAMTRLALYDLPEDELAETVFRAFLTRRPTPNEVTAITSMIHEGFSQRIVLDANPVENPFAWQRHQVSWANHLHSTSTEIMIRLEERARQGDPPTQRLRKPWRESMEDVLWALSNNPEFVFLP